MNLSTLNHHLFEQLRRLETDDLSEEDLRREVARAKAINEIAGTVVQSARISLEAEQFKQSVTGTNKVSLPMIESIPESK